jgi:hypothetical protein
MQMVHLLEQTLYHSLLRIAVCVMACALVFDSGLLVKSTAILSNNTQIYLANAIGVNASVVPTEVNQLTARITELEGELQTKNREIQVNLNENDNANSFDKSTFVLSVILFILLVLIVLNFALDYLRMRNVNPLYKESDSRTA